MTSMLKRVDLAVESFITDFDVRRRRGRHGHPQRPVHGGHRPVHHRRADRRHPGADRRVHPADHRRRDRHPHDSLIPGRRGAAARTAGPGEHMPPGPPACPAPAPPGVGARRCVIMRRCRSDTGRPASGRRGRSHGSRTTIEPTRTPAGRTEGEEPMAAPGGPPAQEGAGDGADRTGRRAAGDHQALPGRRRQPRHRAAGAPGRGARDRRGERRRQVDPDEDALRRAPAGRGHDPRRRPRGLLPQPVGRDRRRHRHGPPALHAGRLLHRAGERRARQRADARRPARPRRGPAPDHRRSPTATTSGSTPTRSSRTSASATGSGSRSPRCSTATPGS